MFSGIFAGFLKVAAIAVVTGGLAGGVIWAANISQSDDGNPLLQTEVTRTVSPPTVTPPQPTPSPDLGTPPAIDTSAWLTYDSPLGISIKYPPSWSITFDSLTDELSALGAHAVIRNGVTDDTGEDMGTPGVMLVIVRRDPGPYNAQHFKDACEPEGGDERIYAFDGPADVPSDVAAAGRPAVLCERRDITPAGLDIANLILTVQLPDDRVIRITAAAVTPTANELGILREVINSFSIVTP